MNNEPQDIEELLISIVTPSEKHIVELYLKNPDTLPPEDRKKAAGMLKQFLSKYPEFAAMQNVTAVKSAPIIVQLSEYKQEMLELKEKYSLWYDSIGYNLSDEYKRCCQEAKEAYRLAIKQEIAGLEVRIKEIIALEAGPIAAATNSSADCKDIHLHNVFYPTIAEKKEKLELWQKRYRNNKFFKAGALGSFLHVGYSHRLPTDPTSWID